MPTLIQFPSNLELLWSKFRPSGAFSASLSFGHESGSGAFPYNLPFKVCQHTKDMKYKLPAAGRGINRLLQALSFAQPPYIRIFESDHTTLSGLLNQDFISIDFSFDFPNNYCVLG